MPVELLDVNTPMSDLTMICERNPQHESERERPGTFMKPVITLRLTTSDHRACQRNAPDPEPSRGS